MVSCALCRWMLEVGTRTLSTMLSIGTPKTSWSTSIIITRCTDIDSGSEMVTLVPRPGSLETAMVPPVRRTMVRTTSMPTPRPERSETCSAVDSPASMISCSASSSLMLAKRASSIRPRSKALCLTFSTSMPRPSSEISMITRSSACLAFSLRTPSSGFPARRRSAGVSRPWSMALRRRWTSGSASSSTTVLSASVSSPSISRRICFSRRRARSRTSRLKRWKTCATGTMRTCITAVCRSSAMRLITSYWALISRAIGLEP